MILTTLRIGGRATFKCDEGFSLKGDDDIECLSSGSWSSWPPNCIEVDCGQPFEIENGRIFLTNQTTNIGSIVEYHCFPGKLLPFTHCLKITKNVSFDFFNFDISTNFCPIKMTCLVTLFDRYLQFCNVEWDFFCDFETPWPWHLGGKKQSGDRDPHHLFALTWSSRQKPGSAQTFHDNHTKRLRIS